MLQLQRLGVFSLYWVLAFSLHYLTTPRSGGPLVSPVCEHVVNISCTSSTLGVNGVGLRVPFNSYSPPPVRNPYKTLVERKGKKAVKKLSK